MAKSLLALLDAKALSLRTKQAKDSEQAKAFIEASARSAESSVIAQKHAEAVESALQTLHDAGVEL